MHLLVGQAVVRQDVGQVLPWLHDAVVHFVVVRRDTIFIYNLFHLGGVRQLHFVQHVIGCPFGQEHKGQGGHGQQHADGDGVFLVYLAHKSRCFLSRKSKEK